MVKKDVNQRWWPRNVCNGRLMAKILITTIQVNLVPNPSGGGSTNSPELALLKFLPLTYVPSQPFLGHHLGFHIFFTLDFLEVTHFLTA